MAVLSRWMAWVTLQAVLVIHTLAAPFPIANYGQHAREILRDLYQKDFGSNYEPVGLTQRDQERLGYEDWQQKGEILSRHKYKFDDPEMFPSSEYELWHDPDFLQGVYKNLFQMVYPALYKEYLNDFLSDLSKTEDERNSEEEGVGEEEGSPLKRTAPVRGFWNYYITNENNLPGLRRRSGFDSADQYVLNEGLPLGFGGAKRLEGNRWGDFKYSRTNRAFAKSAGVSDQDVVNKKGFADNEFNYFDWDNLQNVAKRRGVEDEEAGDGYWPEEGDGYGNIGETWGKFLGEDAVPRDRRYNAYLDDVLNRRAEPIWGLVGPYAGYSMYERLMAEGKRTDDGTPILSQVLELPPPEEEPAIDVPGENSLADEDESEKEDLAGDYSDEDTGHFWDGFIEKFKELPNVPVEPKPDEAEGKYDIDDQDVSDSLVETEDDPADEDDAIADLEEVIPENSDVIEEEIVEEFPEDEDTEEMKSELRLDLIQLLRKFLDLKRQ